MFRSYALQMFRSYGTPFGLRLNFQRINPDSYRELLQYFSFLRNFFIVIYIKYIVEVIICKKEPLAR